MTEFMNAVLQLEAAGAGIIPWVLTALAVSLVLYYRKDVSEWIRERAKAQKTIAERKAEINEIIRNNSAVIENCTVVMRDLTSQTDKMEAAVAVHEANSTERMLDIKGVVEQCRDEIAKARTEHAVLLDRE